jgi:drug/metabolite transporter (DMT)-like permease
MKSTSISGTIQALTAAMLWGVSGTCAQFVFEQKHVDAAWLVTMRLLIAGTLLILFAVIKGDKTIVTIWHNKRDVLQLILSGVLGMFAIQYTYFAAIVASNAATATVLQYTGPVFMAIYFSIINRKLPMALEVFAILLAFTGVFFLVTQGNINSLAISSEALFWGIASAIAVMFYSLLPIPLLKKYSTFSVIGWSMLLGGIASSFVGKPWAVTGIWDASTFLAVAFIILLGSLAAFYMYLNAVKEIGAQTASILACSEPLAAVFLAVFWLDVSFFWSDWVGTACILITIAVLSMKKEGA